MSPTWSDRTVEEVLPGADPQASQWALLGRDFEVLTDGTLLKVREHRAALTAEEREPTTVFHLSLDDDESKVYFYVKAREPVVYYAESVSDGVIKIGTSTQLGWRIASIDQIGHGPWKLLAIERGGYREETMRHRQFEHRWLAPTQKGESRELFEPAPDLIDHINDLLQGPRFRPFTRCVEPPLVRYVLPRRVAQPAFRPRMTARVTQAVQDNLAKVAEQQGLSVDEIVEQLLVEHVPQAAPDPPVVPRQRAATRADVKRILAEKAAYELAQGKATDLP